MGDPVPGPGGIGCLRERVPSSLIHELFIHTSLTFRDSPVSTGPDKLMNLVGEVVVN